MRLLSWNVGRRDLWEQVATGGFDVALLQNTGAPAKGTDLDVVPAEPWEADGAGAFRTAVAARPGALSLRPRGEVAVSRPGTLAVADVVRDGEVVLTVASAYGTWESPAVDDGLIFSDASAHRLLSDLAQLVTSRDGHRLLVAGDWNMLYGYSENADAYWAGRQQSVFDRAAAMGLAFMGPQAPDGRQADPWPEQLPRASRNVPTFHDDTQTPATATRQLDYVLASTAIADRVHTGALNSPNEWGPSDHCRLAIDVDL